MFALTNRRNVDHMKKPSRLISSIVAVAATLVATIGLQALPANAAACVSGGDGTAISPVVICTANDFAALKSPSAANYVLGADIDLANTYWNSYSDFDGTLDGAGHTVSNFGLGSSEMNPVNGLFDDLGASSVIKNIRFTKANMSVESRAYVGFLAYSIGGIVDNVQIEGTVYTDSQYTGGFSGQLLGGSITNSISNINFHHSTGGYVTGFYGVSFGSPDRDLGTISNSIFIGTFDGGLQNPISLRALPWWDHQSQQNPPMSTCDQVVQTYYLSTSTSSPLGCGVSKTEAELASANSTTEGFSSWSTDKWVFGQGARIPQLKSFALAPNQQLFPSITPGAASIHLGWLAPLGEYITSFDVQTRTRTSYWSDAQKTSVEDGATITGLNNGTAYWVRVRSVNPNGQSDWNYVSTPVVPIDVAAAVRNVVMTSKKGVLTVTWLAPTTNNGSAISKYQIGLFKSATAATPYKVVTSSAALKVAIKGQKLKSKVWVAIRSQNAVGLSPFNAKIMTTVK